MKQTLTHPTFFIPIEFKIKAVKPLKTVSNRATKHLTLSMEIVIITLIASFGAIDNTSVLYNSKWIHILLFC